MTTPDICEIWLTDANKTISCGLTLRKTLHRFPVSVTLQGGLGAGKTTFLQGVLQGLGGKGVLTSPTYALEQRYQTDVGELHHLDLYRLNEEQASRLIRELELSPAPTLRCIEWPERAHVQGDISITLEDDPAREGRSIRIEFTDIPIPTKQQIFVWREEVKLPAHIAAHCDAVSRYALELADQLIDEGMIIRKGALEASALIHDLFRFIDFRPGAAHPGGETEEAPEWDRWRKKFTGKKHEAACADFLREKGYLEIATIVEVHGLALPSPERTTIEQKLLFYADKRVMGDKVVSLQERFDDFTTRYAGGESTKQGKIWMAECEVIEQELFNN